MGSRDVMRQNCGNTGRQLGRPNVVMRPGQLDPNDFELAILRQLAEKRPALGPSIPELQVLSREFTGVGSYTTFRCANDVPENPNDHVGLDMLIALPGVPNGLGAILWLKNAAPAVLEIFAYGEDLWDGVYDGFAFVSPA